MRSVRYTRTRADPANLDGSVRFGQTIVVRSFLRVTRGRALPRSDDDRYACPNAARSSGKLDIIITRIIRFICKQRRRTTFAYNIVFEKLIFVSPAVVVRSAAFIRIYLFILLRSR